MKIRAVLFALGIAAFASQGIAAVMPHAGPGDPRNRVVMYDPAQVVELQGVLGYQMLIEFAPDEKIENVAIGDSLGWQVTPNRAANLLFVKPMSKVPVTNMTVVTDQRQYVFELNVVPRARESAIIYTLRFEYPPLPDKPADAPPPPPPQIANSAYSYDGSQKILPTRIFDDGHATYFQFHGGQDYPAIFAVDADKGEAVVNSSMRDGYVVVDRIARGFVLRQGSEVTHIYNDGFKEATPGPEAPQPHKKECTNILCL